MRYLLYALVVLFFVSCSSNNSSPVVTKLKQLTEIKERPSVDTLDTKYFFIKEFYLVEFPPNTIEEFKRLMNNVAAKNVHSEFRDEKFVFVKNSFLYDYKKEQSGIDPEDILGSILYENKRQTKEVSVETEEYSFYGK